MRAPLATKHPLQELPPLANRPLSTQMANLMADFGRLRESPRELFVTMLMCSGAAFTYNTMANTMTVFATAEYGFDDVETGAIYGWWGLMSSLWAMVLVAVGETVIRSADTPLLSLLKHLLKVEGGVSRMTVSPTARC